MSIKMRGLKEEILTEVIREFGFENPITIDVARLVDDERCGLNMMRGLTRIWTRRERERLAAEEG